MAKQTTKKKSGKGHLAERIDAMIGRPVALRGAGAAQAAPIGVIPTGSLSLDSALGIGGWPRGRVVEVFGDEACFDGDTRVSYQVRLPGRSRPSNSKGGSVKRLWERFNGVTPEGDGRGKYHRAVSEGAEFFAPSVNEDNRVAQNRIVDVVRVGVREVFRLTADNGFSTTVTEDHKFFNGIGFVRLADLRPGDELLVHNNTRWSSDHQKPTRGRAEVYVKHHPHAPDKVVRDKQRGYSHTYKRLKRARASLEAAMNGLDLESYVARLNSGELGGLVFSDPEMHVHHLNEDFTDDRPENLMLIGPPEHGRLHAVEKDNNLRFVAVPARVTSVEPVGEREVFDIKMASPFHTVVADGFVTHNSGKTTLALHGLAEAQKLGEDGLYVDAEHAVDFGYAERIGVNLEDLAVVQPDNGEEALETADFGIRAGAKYVVIDSVAALIPKSDLDKFGQTQLGSLARLMSQNVRNLVRTASQFGATIVFINQTRSKVGFVLGSPRTTTGGNALKFYSTVRVDVARSGKVESGGKTQIGIEVRAKVVKNKLAPPFQAASYDIIWGQGIDRGMDIIKAGLACGLLTKSGSWVVLGNDKLGQSVVKAAAAVTENAELEARLVTQVSEMIQERRMLAAATSVAEGGRGDIEMTAKLAAEIDLSEEED